MTRAAMQRAAQNSGEDERPRTWAEVELDSSEPSDYYLVDFHGAESVPSPFFRGRSNDREITNWAAAGQAYRPHVEPDTGARGHLADRWNQPR